MCHFQLDVIFESCHICSKPFLSRLIFEKGMHVKLHNFERLNGDTTPNCGNSQLKASMCNSGLVVSLRAGGFLRGLIIKLKIAFDLKR